VYQDDILSASGFGRVKTPSEGALIWPLLREKRRSFGYVLIAAFSGWIPMMFMTRAPASIFSAQSASGFNGLRQNSLLKRPGNYFRRTGKIVARTGKIIAG
jgi:hypothetical protein